MLNIDFEFDITEKHSIILPKIPGLGSLFTVVTSTFSFNFNLSKITKKHNETSKISDHSINHHSFIQFIYSKTEGLKISVNV